MKIYWKKMLKNVIALVLALGMIITMATPASATELLGANDNVFTVNMYSAYAGERFEAAFFKKDNSLYISEGSLCKMVELKQAETGSMHVQGWSRTDEENAVFLYRKSDVFVFDGVTYYPFVDVMSDLRINVTYDRELEQVRVIPAKNVWNIEAVLSSMYDNKTYNMSYWQNADFLGADISRLEAQIADIGRHMYALPAYAYKYASGDADMESYRSALWKIMVPMIDVDTTSLTVFDEMAKYIQGGTGAVGDIANLAQWNSVWKMLGENKIVQGTTQIAAVVGDLRTLMQAEDVLEVIKFYYSLEMLDSGVTNGVKRIYSVGLADNAPLNEAFEDTLENMKKQDPLPVRIAEEAGDGVVELLFSGVSTGINANIAEFGTNLVDFAGPHIFSLDILPYIEVDYNAKHVDNTIVATSNLHIQNAAKRSYLYYKNLYETTENIQKKTDALENMKDITLIYMLAGHNAWKAFEFDEELAASSQPVVEEILVHLRYLMSYDAADFDVYENAVNTKHTIMAQYENREQTYYFFSWNEEKGEEVGGLQFSLEGKDQKGRGFLYQKLFSHMYYLQNGLQVGNIRTNGKTDSNSRIVETYAIDGICEVVIRANHAGASVADVDMEVAQGISSNMWTEDLSIYLVTEADGSVIYRIPLPLGGGASAGESMPATRVDANFDFEKLAETEKDTMAEHEKVELPIGSLEDYKGETLFENEKYTIAVDSITDDEDYCVTLSFTNKSVEALSFMIFDSALNGLMCGENLESLYVEAGQTETEKLSFRDSWLEKHGLDKITEIFLTIQASDSNYNMIGKHLFTVHPLGEGAVTYYEYTPKENDVLLAETGNYRVYGSVEAKSSSLEIKMYAENHTDETVMLDAGTAAANNSMIDMNLSGYIAPGKGRFLDTIIWDDDLREADIRDVEDVIMITMLCTVTNHYEGLNTVGGGTTEEVFSQNVSLYVPGKENREVPAAENRGTLLLEDDYVQVSLVSVGFGEEPYLEFAVVNKSETLLGIDFGNAVIADKVWAWNSDSGEVISGAKGMFRITWRLNELREAGVDIGAVEGFPFSFTIYGRKGYMGELLFENTVNAQSFVKY